LHYRRKKIIDANKTRLEVGRLCWSRGFAKASRRGQPGRPHGTVRDTGSRTAARDGRGHSKCASEVITSTSAGPVGRTVHWQRSRGQGQTGISSAGAYLTQQGRPAPRIRRFPTFREALLFVLEVLRGPEQRADPKISAAANGDICYRRYQFS
jgi:hypothetical protein